MYNLLSLLAGVAIAILVTLNGQLSSAHGVFVSAVIIHIVGILFAILLLLILRKKFTFKSTCPAWAYLGGVIGVLTTVFNNFSFGKISVTSILALGLFGQTVTALLFDHFGILGTKKQTFKVTSLFGLVFALGGIFMMFDASSGIVLYAILLSVAAGVSSVLSRSVNAVLANEIGALQGSLINHIAGLPVCVVVLFLLGRNELTAEFAFHGSTPWIYIGGAFGVIAVLLYNIVVPKVPAFYVTLLAFIGQVFAGLVIDVMMNNGYSKRTMIGGVLVSVGVGINMILEQIACKRRQGGGGE